MSYENKCILAQPVATKAGIKPICKLAGSDKCNSFCIDYNLLHGESGLSGRIGQANVPEEYRLNTVQTSSARQKQPNVYPVIDKYIESFHKMFVDDLPREQRIRSLYLYSENSGTGKTETATAILNEYIMRHYIGSLQKGQKPLQNVGYYLDVNEWQNLYSGFTRPNIPAEVAMKHSNQFYEQMEIAKHTQFLVLDDLAVRQTVTDAFRGELHSIVNHRVSNVKPTVYTSNVPLDELPNIFGEQRLYDRVRHYCIQLQFEGDSNRGIGGKK
jgi:DNA replication protein DnaC